MGDSVSYMHALRRKTICFTVAIEKIPTEALFHFCCSGHYLNETNK